MGGGQDAAQHLQRPAWCPVLTSGARTWRNSKLEEAGNLQGIPFKEIGHLEKWALGEPEALGKPGKEGKGRKDWSWRAGDAVSSTAKREVSSAEGEVGGWRPEEGKHREMAPVGLGDTRVVR